MFTCRWCKHTWEQKCKDGDHLECPKCGWKFIAMVWTNEQWEEALFPVFDFIAATGQVPDDDDYEEE